MRDYVLPRAKHDGIPWWYISKKYQREQEARVESLINYQAVNYPFFWLVNGTTKEDIEYFDPLAASQSIKPSEFFPPTNKDTLFEIPYNPQDDSTYNITTYDNDRMSYIGYGSILHIENNATIYYIIFVNALNIHQGFLVYDDNYILCFINKKDFLARYHGSESKEQGLSHITITQDAWESLIWRPSTIDYNIFLKATNSSASVSSDDSHGFFTYKTLTSTFINWSLSIPEETPFSGSSVDTIHDNGIYNLTTSYFIFIDSYGNPLFTSFNSQGVIRFIDRGVIFYSNTYYHNITSSLNKALIFHLSDFDGVVWTSAGSNIKLQAKEHISKTYGLDIVLPVPSKDLRFMTVNDLPLDGAKENGINLFTRSQTSKAEWAGNLVITQPQTICGEEVVGDFYYQTVISKIENKTKYYYTIINENEKNQASLTIASI